jgi:hypothetical protein
MHLKRPFMFLRRSGTAYGLLLPGRFLIFNCEFAVCITPAYGA